MKMACQPSASATRLAMGRASMMPISRPLDGADRLAARFGT
jgi:hypothetical protein